MSEIVYVPEVACEVSHGLLGRIKGVRNRFDLSVPDPLSESDQVRNQDPVPPRRLDPTIPRDLETIALKCLAKEPGRRYVTATALADDLRRWLDGHPIAARPAGPVERAGRWGRRHPAIASLAASLILSLVTGFWGMYGLWRQAKAERNRVVAALRESDQDLRVATEAMHRVEEFLATSAGDPRREEDVVFQNLAQSFIDQHAGIRALTHGDSKVMASLSMIHRMIGGRLIQSGSPRSGKEWLKKAVSFRLASLEQDPDSQLMAGGLVWDVLLIKDASLQIGEFDDVNPYLDRAFEVVMKTSKDPDQRRIDIFRIDCARFEILEQEASAARRDRNLKTACRTEKILLTQARLLVDSHPEDPGSHVLLSRAYHQAAKNAWQVEDMPAIVGALQLSRDAAIKAQSLAPGDPRLNLLVEDRRSRLVGLVSNP